MRTIFMMALLVLSFATNGSAAEPLIRVIVWDEQQPAQKQAYDNFLGNAIADHLGKQPGLRVISANINQPEKGLPASLLDNTDVLVWWGHVRHNDISPEMAKDIVARIKRGQLAFIGLHSAHWSAPFMEAMNERTRDDARRRYPDPPNGPPVKFEFIAPEGRFVPTADSIRTPAFYAMKRGAQLTVRVDLPNCVFPSYRNDGKPSTVKVLKPDHPIAKGLPASFELPQTEMYADPFHVPDADEVLFEESWAAGESFRSGLIWKLGEGRVFYFRPGHETYPIFKQELPLKVVTNAVNWLGSNMRKTEAVSLLNFNEQPKTIVCLGDSVTGVYYHTGGYRAYPEMLEIAIRKALPDAKVKVINAGISGHTTNEGLVRLDRDVLSKKPDLVTISFGLNDMSRMPEDLFRKNLDTLVARCREAKSLIVLCTPNTVLTTSGRPIEKLQRYCEIIRTAGRELNVPVCDQFTAGETLRAKEALAWRLTLSDEIHPNMDGHKLMAEELCRSITGQSVTLADVAPPAPLTKTLALAKEGKLVKVLAMPPFDTLIGPALKRSFPNAVVEVTPWSVAGKTLREIETAANQTVRAMKPNLVILAIPRSAKSDPDEEFVRSYSWAMNWSLSFGQAEWDCLVVHPAVVAPTETSPRDDLVRRLVKAQDLHLLDRAKADDSTPEAILIRWIESSAAAVQKGN